MPATLDGVGLRHITNFDHLIFPDVISDFPMMR